MSDKIDHRRGKPNRDSKKTAYYDDFGSSEKKRKSRNKKSAKKTYIDWEHL